MGQMLLIVGAMMLLATVTVSVNNIVLDHMQRTYEAQAVISSTTFAQAMMQEVGLKFFDEKIVGRSPSLPITPDTMTAVASIGKDAGETYPNFDDVDDYKNFKKTVVDPRLRNFQVSVNVWYVNPASPNDTSSVRTFYKKVAVTVSDSTRSILSLPLQLTNIISF